VFSKACPLFVPLVEEGWTEGEVPMSIAEKILKNNN
jgi:glutamate racemase